MARRAGRETDPRVSHPPRLPRGTRQPRVATLCGLTTDTKRNGPMRRVFLMTCLATLGASGLAAQATGMPLYNAPYRAFQRSEIGGAVSFPSSAGTAFLGMYRMASGKLDLGFQAGIWTPSCTGCKSGFLAGVEARDRVITHNADFPLAGAVVVGVGAPVLSAAHLLFLPSGLTLVRPRQ